LVLIDAALDRLMTQHKRLTYREKRPDFPTGGPQALVLPAIARWGRTFAIDEAVRSWLVETV
jgi:hypothetical protein